MAEEACYTEAVSLSTYIRSCDTVEEALGITLDRMRSLEQVTKQLTEGRPSQPTPGSRSMNGCT
jgi:hypothetical protein